MDLTTKRHSAVVRFESIRSVIALGAQHKLQLHQMDVSMVFLNGEFTEEIYMRQPEGFIEKGKEHLVCSLNCSIYGLKQSPRCWNHALDRQLREMKFKPTSGDPCLYVRADPGGEIFLVAVYADDIILGGKSEAKVDTVKRELSLNEGPRNTSLLPWSKDHPRSTGWNDLDRATHIYKEHSATIQHIVRFLGDLVVDIS